MKLSKGAKIQISFEIKGKKNTKIILNENFAKLFNPALLVSRAYLNEAA